MSNVEDHLAIRELAARYNRAFDYGDPEAWTECFTEDGSFYIGSKELAAGKQALLEFARKSIPGMKVKHCTTDAIVEVDGDTGTHDAYLILMDCGEKISVSNCGRYLDDVVRQNGKWKFKKRVVRLDGR